MSDKTVATTAVKKHIIKLYKQRVKANRVKTRRIIPVEDYFFGNGRRSVTLNCWELKPGKKPGFRHKKDYAGYQYDLRAYQLTSQRPLAWRVPFLLHKYYELEGYTVSHLCHNSKCYRWKHHRFEPLPVNKGRNGCPGGLHCHHKEQCIMPGPYYNC